MVSMVEASDLRQAQGGDRDAFARLSEPHRAELLVHCYRMLGSLQDAEDVVQEALLRAWRGMHTFERVVSFRAWLYKITTNVCLNVLAKRRSRALPATLLPAADPGQQFAPPLVEKVWIEPLPDELMDEAAGPEERYMQRESVTLAFLVALQSLPARQRAVLLMRDVLDFSANEVAASLELTVPAVNSALQRARVTLARHYHGRGSASAPPPEETVAVLLQRYVAAWERSDVGMLVALLKEDAALAMPPSPSWFSGREAIAAFLAKYPFAGGEPGRWRLLPRRANGQPAFEMHLLDAASNQFWLAGLQVLTLAGDRIAEIDVFLQPEFFPRSGFSS